MHSSVLARNRWIPREPEAERGQSTGLPTSLTKERPCSTFHNKPGLRQRSHGFPPWQRCQGRESASASEPCLGSPEGEAGLLAQLARLVLGDLRPLQKVARFLACSEISRERWALCSLAFHSPSPNNPVCGPPADTARERRQSGASHDGRGQPRRQQRRLSGGPRPMHGGPRKTCAADSPCRRKAGPSS